MAGLKKKKKEKSGSPNVVLVIFMVFFVIGNITLGVFFYLSLEEKHDANKRRALAEEKYKVENLRGDYYAMLWNDLRTGLTADPIDAKDLERLVLDRDVFLAEDFGKFKGEPSKDVARKLMVELRNTLKVGADKNYEKRFPDLLKAAQAEADKLRGEAGADAKALVLARQQLAEITKNQDKIFQDALTRIETGNKEALDAAKKKNDEFKALVDNNVKLNQELRDKGKEMEDLKSEHGDALKLKERELVILRAENKEAAGLGAKAGNVQQPVMKDPFPLVLDINTIKPLWDTPVGKITRVDLDLRQVVINVGSHHGAKPELTFTVFNASSAGRAEKGMKASIEIVKVLDSTSSLARITTLFDADGVEIPLGLQTRGRILRETDAPLREGDLIFNMFWGTRVAIAGLISLDETTSSNPADQMRAVSNMISLVERMGMQVDAWVDLASGEVQGKITNKTRYLIIGDAVQVSASTGLEGDWKGQNIELNISGNAFKGELRIAGADDKVDTKKLSGVIQENGGRRFLSWGENENVEILLDDAGKRIVLENKALNVRLELGRVNPGRDLPMKKEMKEMKEDPPEKKEGDDPEKKVEDKKEGAKDPPLRGRSALIAAGIKQLRDEATAKGLLQISTENFVNVIGYRRPRSANLTERAPFRPFLPYAGAIQMVAPREPMPGEEKKAPPPPDEK